MAADLAGRLEGSGDVWNLIWARLTQVHILALRGQTVEITATLDWLEPAARGVESVSHLIHGLGSAAMARAELGQNERAAVLLSEVEETDDARTSYYYPAVLPAMVRAALGVGAPELAERLVAGFVPRTPYAEHALVAANAAVTEARGDLQSAADTYADAADRWDRFGIVPELAFALLGQGRSLVGLSRPTEAAPVLQHAREIFERLQAAPALAETDALLAAAA